MSTEPDRAAGVVERLARVRRRIHEAAEAAGRSPDDVRLLLATKTVPPSLIRVALQAGATTIGENRVQELVAKSPELADLTPRVHLIGHLQSNKVNHALRWVTCVESVDSVEIARRLADRAVEGGRVLDVLLQVNVSGETTKFGLAPDDAEQAAVEVAGLDGLRLRGFMTIGANSADTGLVRAGYARLRELRDAVVASGAVGTSGAVELSMGMSGDLETAIAEGATTVRIGSAVFGSRVV
jgi:pyridoxal phosphate enzyme (YggS family)